MFTGRGEGDCSSSAKLLPGCIQEISQNPEVTTVWPDFYPVSSHSFRKSRPWRGRAPHSGEGVLTFGIGRIVTWFLKKPKV
jgi:hypothetical protein